MKKSVPPYIVVAIVLVVIGVCAFIYNRTPIEPVPDKDAKPIKIDFNPHKFKAERLKEQQEKADKEKGSKDKGSTASAQKTQLGKDGVKAKTADSAKTPD